MNIVQNFDIHTSLPRFPVLVEHYIRILKKTEE